MKRGSLGLQHDDLSALDRLGNHESAALGFLDVTASPFRADPSGTKDSTLAIADAVFFARYHKLAVWFPAGDYLVSDTIRCEGGWQDLRTAYHKYLPYIELWPCVLLGDQGGERRARIVLAPQAPGFQDPTRPKCVLDFIGYNFSRKTLTERPAAGQGNTMFNMTLHGLDVVVGPDNAGAAAVGFNCAEASTIQDCGFDVGDGFTGILGGPGSGGAIYGVRVTGGQYGAVLNASRPPCTLVGCSFRGQRQASAVYRQRGSLVLVGCEFDMQKGVTALVLPAAEDPFLSAETLGLPGAAFFPRPGFPSTSLIDCTIRYPEGAEGYAPCVDCAGAVYMKNVRVLNAASVCRTREFGVVGEGGNGWRTVLEMAVSGRYRDPVHAGLYLDGRLRESPLVEITTGGEPVEDAVSSHLLWDPDSYPQWNAPQAVNVRTAYGASGDGETDDTAALQRAIDEHEIVFLPRGFYAVSKTLRLRPETKLIGVNAAYSLIVPRSGPGSDFSDPSNPRPVLQTADTTRADTQLAWFGVFMPRELAPGAYMLDWACGGRSCMRCVFPVFGSTSPDLEPLARGVYPWNNWEWSDFDPTSFGHRVGGATIFSQDNSPPAPGIDVEVTPDFPITRVHGNGGGGWYPFMAMEGRSQGPNRHRILVSNCTGPFSIYHAHLQFSRGAAEMKIEKSRGVSIHGMKNEKHATVIHAVDSDQLLITGFGGIGQGNPTGKFLIEACGDVTLANLIDDALYGPLPMVREIRPDGSSIVTAEHDMVALYKRTQGQPEPKKETRT